MTITKFFASNDASIYVRYLDTRKTRYTCAHAAKKYVKKDDGLKETSERKRERDEI